MKKIFSPMNLLLSLFLANNTTAQEYIRLNQEEVVYDVDVVVFARRLSQPSSEIFNNASLVNTDAARILSPVEDDVPMFVYPEPEETPATNEQSDEWQVPIEEQPKLIDVLSWVLLEKNMAHPIISRLAVNPNFKPLLHQKWRQPATAFLQPEYVQISLLEPSLGNNDETEEPDDSTGVNMANDMLGSLFPVPQIHPDYTVDGQVAFSKQRFTHLHVKMNLFRVNAEGEQIIHKISQQKQVDLGEWQYFDHQQFGVLAKVTAVELKPVSQEG